MKWKWRMYFCYFPPVLIHEIKMYEEINIEMAYHSQKRHVFLNIAFG